MNFCFHPGVFLILNVLVEGRVDASMRMPHNRDQPLGDREIEILRLWVDQGAINN